MLITVLTPTYNRAALLPDAFASLVAQAEPEMEWVVVDDGSTDDTVTVMNDLAARAPFDIRLITQTNQGKNIALNAGVTEARGSFIAQLDSDDVLLPGALASLRDNWLAIPEQRREGFVGVVGLCVDDDGTVMGEPLTTSPTDCSYQDILYRHGCSRAAKWGIVRTDVLRAHPFPLPLDGAHVPEGVVWRQIGKRYLTRYVNDEYLMYRQVAMGHSDQITTADPARHARGLLLSHAAVLNEDLPWLRYAVLDFARSSVHFTRFAFHCRLSLGRQAELLPGWRSRVLWALGVPVGWAVYRRDLHRTGAARP